MTVHNSLKYGSDVQNALELAAGMSADEEGVIRLSETLTPGIDVWSLPEWAFLRQERLGAIKMFSAAVVGESAIIALGNPIGSGAIVVVEAVSYCCTTAALTATLEVAADSAVAGTLSAAAFAVSGRDRRFGSTIGRTFVKTGSDPANTFGVLLEEECYNAINLPYTPFNNLPVVLKPGDDLLVIGQGANLALSANFKWRERKAFNGELPA